MDCIKELSVDKSKTPIKFFCYNEDFTFGVKDENEIINDILNEDINVNDDEIDNNKLFDLLNDL